MNKIAISIIIPIYNTEPYLKRCLESCINQTLDEIEIICINDNSPDKSDAIVREYLEKYPEKMKYIELDNNIKLGGARNRGVEVSRGEYLCFVDSDDYIDLRLCEEVYAKALNEEADIVCFDFYNVKNETVEYIHTFGQKLENIWYAHPYSPCMEIVKRSLIVDNNLFFPENTFYEDIAIVPLWKCMASKIVKMDNAYYFYVRRKDSITSESSLDVRLQPIESVKFRQQRMVEKRLLEKLKAQNDKLIISDLVRILKRVLILQGRFTYDTIAKIEEKLLFLKGYTWNEELFKYFFTKTELDLAQALLDNPNRLIEDYAQMSIFDKKNVKNGYLESLYDDILDIIQESTAQYGENIAVWGCGEKGLPMISTMNSLNLQFDVYDNIKKGYVQLDNIKKKINSIEDLSERVNIVLVTSSLYYESIKKQINKKCPRIYVLNLFEELIQRGDRRLLEE